MKLNTFLTFEAIKMDTMTFFIYIGMYVYGFSLIIWALFFDKHPTKKTKKAALFGLIGLTLTVFYFAYVLLTIGLS
jgi:Zn-dependent protease with chaperone function